MVEVTTDLVGSDLDRIEIQARSDRGGEASQTFPAAELPGRLALVPRGDPDLGFEVTARALRNTQEIHSLTASLRFHPGQAVEGTLHISRACTSLVAARPSCGQEACVMGRCVARDRAILNERPLGSGGTPDAGTDARVDGPATPMPDAPPDCPTDRPIDGSVVMGNWTVSASALVPGGALNAVFPVGTGAGEEVWAVGVNGPDGVAQRFDGQAQTWEASVLPPLTRGLFAVWAASAADVWVAGVGGTILRRTNNLWQPVASGTSVTLASIWGSGANDVWIVGGRTVLRWNGSALESLNQGITSDLAAVTGVGASDLWAVGLQGNVFRGSPRGWNRENHNLTQNILYAVWAGSTSDIWAVGQNVTLHGDAMGWSVVNLSAPVAVLGVWGSAANDVWAVGRPATGSGGTIARWNGLSWSQVPPNPTAGSLQAIRGRSARDIWTVGENGLVLRFR